DGLRLGPLGQPDVDLVVLHRRIEELLDDRAEPVDLVDEQDVPFAQVRQDPDEVARLLQDGAGRGLDVHAQLARHEHGERSLAEPWRAVEQRVVERFTPRERGIDGDAEALLDLRLADELLQPLRPQRQLDRALLAQDFRRGDLRTHALPCECFRAALGVGAWYPGEPWGLRAPQPAAAGLRRACGPPGLRAFGSWLRGTSGAAGLRRCAPGIEPERWTGRFQRRRSRRGA